MSPPIDPDIKLSALTGAGAGGESIAGKDDAGRMRSPADRLGLAGKPRAKAEKCLADAVYFEARGEPLRGQEAVAQVVMNRVFSGFYPNNVCGVVYQNANRHLACQFTFACEGKNGSSWIRGQCSRPRASVITTSRVMPSSALRHTPAGCDERLALDEEYVARR